jgi:hypothetical protein
MGFLLGIVGNEKTLEKQGKNMENSYKKEREKPTRCTLAG